MKKRFLALLLAVCMICSMLAVPASAAGSNAAVQTAVTLGALTVQEAAECTSALTRGQLAKFLTVFSAYREGVETQGSVGTLFRDVNSTLAEAPYIRIAVQQGWMSGYTDGSFRPANTVTLEEACTAALKLLGYDVTALSGGFPAAQLNKASLLGLRDGVSCKQGEAMTVEDAVQLFYNLLTADTADGKAYASTLGFTVTGGQVDLSSVQLSDVKGPFVAQGGEQLAFAPAAVYRNNKVSDSAELSAYDVYYYHENSQTIWIYNRRAAGRITAVAPSASTPTSVTVAGREYTLANSAAAAQISALNGGGVGQVVTLLLGMNDEVVSVLTGEQADAVFYGVVQSASRSLIEENGADVQQTVTVACTDGVTRSVNVDKDLNYPTGWLVEITVDEKGEQVSALSSRSTNGTFSENGMSLGETALAADVEILDTTAEGVAGAVSPSRLSGVKLSAGDVRYYTTNENGEIDRLILNNVTGDLLTYAVLDDVKNAVNAVTSSSSSGSGSAMPTNEDESESDSKVQQIAEDVADIVLPSTSDILYGIVDGSIGSTLWESLTSSRGSLASYALKLLANNTSGTLSSVLDYLGSGADYTCYVNGKQTVLKTSVKYPVVAGGIAVTENTNGSVKSMTQLIPTVVDKIGAASVMSGSKRYETADEMQVYLWYKGQYYATTLSQLNTEEYSLIGWYDNMGCAAGGKIRVLVAVKK